LDATEDVKWELDAGVYEAILMSEDQGSGGIGSRSGYSNPRVTHLDTPVPDREKVDGSSSSVTFAAAAVGLDDDITVRSLSSLTTGRATNVVTLPAGMAMSGGSGTHHQTSLERGRQQAIAIRACVVRGAFVT
jgi:hypothetical protein